MRERTPGTGASIATHLRPFRVKRLPGASARPRTSALFCKYAGDFSVRRRLQPLTSGGGRSTGELETAVADRPQPRRRGVTPGSR
jgi:hypothetical protein